MPETSLLAITQIKTMTMFAMLLLWTLALSLAAPVSSEYEVPTKKVKTPKMDPIPTLPKVTHRVFFDIQIDEENTGRIILGLFGEIAPKAVANFVALCNCDKGKAQLTGKDLCYKGSTIHRVIPNFMFQASFALITPLQITLDWLRDDNELTFLRLYCTC
jgi:hypothetical protein